MMIIMGGYLAQSLHTTLTCLDQTEPAKDFARLEGLSSFSRI